MRCYTLANARQHLSRVTALILDGQQLEQIPPEVWQMPQLETLDLQRNALKILPETMGALKSLKHLLLGRNQLKQVPQSLPNLVQIDLSGNRFTDFPVALARLEQLQTINLSSNRIGNLPNLAFPALKELNLSANKIAVCLLAAAFLPSLVKLDLSYNRLKEIDLQGVFNALDTLNVAHNQLFALPNCWEQTPFLRHLYLHYNQLAQLPPTFSHCNWLKTMHLAKNKFNSLPGFVAVLPRLEELNLSRNALSNWPSLPPSLRKLQVTHNQLTKIPAHFFQQTALRKLDLSHNPIRHIQGLAHGVQLTHLSLHGLHADTLAPEVLALTGTITIKASSNDPQWISLSNFVRACQRKQVATQARLLLWAAHEQKVKLDTLPLELIFQGLNLGIPLFEERLQKHLLEERSQLQNFSIGEGINALAIVGRSSQTITELKNRLNQKGIQLQRPEQCSVWVLAKAPYPHKLPAAKGVSWLDERALEQLLSTDLPGFDDQEQQNLLQLLLHEDSGYVQLAIQLLHHNGVPSAVLPYLYLVWRWTKEAKLRRDLRGLLERNWPLYLQNMLRNREKISRGMTQEALEQRVAEILERFSAL